MTLAAETILLLTLDQALCSDYSLLQQSGFGSRNFKGQLDEYWRVLEIIGSRETNQYISIICNEANRYSIHEMLLLLPIPYSKKVM